MIGGHTNKELLGMYDELVVGHTEAKKTLINLVNRSKIRHYQKWIALEPSEFLIPTTNCLLIGGSGTGKTFLVQSLQKIIDFPLIIVDATRLTMTSASGGVKNSDIIDMIRCKAREHAEDNSGYYHSVEGAMDQMVVFIDEIDKLAWGVNENDAWNKRVQANFLSIFENSDELSGCSFIFAGAFSGLESVKKDVKSSIGFCGTNGKKEPQKLLDEAVVKYGLIPELVGRIPNIIELDKFTRDDYRKILFETLIPIKQSELLYYNCQTVSLSEEVVESILDKVEDSGQGVRSLKRELNKITSELEFNYENVDDHPLLLTNLVPSFKV